MRIQLLTSAAVICLGLSLAAPAFATALSDAQAQLATDTAKLNADKAANNTSALAADTTAVNNDNLAISYAQDTVTSAFPEGSGVTTYDLSTSDLDTVTSTSGATTASLDNSAISTEAAGLGTANTTSAETAAETSEQAQVNSEMSAMNSGLNGYINAEQDLYNGTDQTDVNKAESAYSSDGYGSDYTTAESRLSACTGSGVTSCGTGSSNPYFEGSYCYEGYCLSQAQYNTDVARYPAVANYYKPAYNTTLYNLDNGYNNAESQMTSDQNTVNNFMTNLF